MKRTPIVLIAFALILLLTACSGSPATQTPTPAPSSESPVPTSDTVTLAPTIPAGTVLHVFAAASLTDAFKAMQPAFEAAYPGVTVVYNFAGSQQLATQINEGAPADVFAAANSKQMEVVITGGRITSGSEQIFVLNRLVVITPKTNPAGITNLSDLAKPGIKLVLADKAVPVGQYSLDFLTMASTLPEYSATYSDTVLANVVSYEDNVRSVLTKVVLGEADAGIVYTTDAALETDTLQLITIPDDLNTIANYPIAPLADSQVPDLAQAFIDYVLSPAGQAVLKEFGFIPVPDSAN